MEETTLCYIEKDGAYLMQHRVKKEKDMNRDKWIGVGGHIEFGESPFDCVKREIHEETGLTVAHPRYRGIVTFVLEGECTEFMHLFTATEFSGELIEECREGVHEWVKKEKIRSLPIWEGDKIFFDLLEKETRFFSLKLVYRGEKLIEHKVDFA